MLRLKVQITKSSQTTLIREVPPWEAMVLEGLYGERFQVLEEIEGPEWDGDAASEYERLGSAYRDPDDPDATVVEKMFGPGRQGIMALAREMETAAKWRSPVAGTTESKARKGEAKSEAA